jgi:hypothetical protein
MIFVLSEGHGFSRAERAVSERFLSAEGKRAALAERIKKHLSG